MSTPVSYKIEAFHEEEKTKRSYDNDITNLVREYIILDKSQIRKETIDEVFKVLCGRTLEDIIQYNGTIKSDIILHQQETIEELKTNYWNLKQQLFKKTGK